MAKVNIIKARVGDLIRAYNLQNARVIRNENNPYDGKVPQDITRDKPLYMSTLGTPVVSDITFKGRTYINNAGKSVTFADVRLETVLLVVSQSKKIELTEIAGRNGTVKEYISDGDYEVAVNGIITGPNGHHPAEEVRALKNMLDASVEIEVVSRYLQNLDIYNLVVKDYAFQQEAGGYAYQGFTINCLSDFPVELQIV
jgi:hypothetical protein